ncbi:hypothetical protein M3Y94_00074400 [Aphelenchoides besseyi]|nr:hypothetical protein M3Y94_00074400 [Aphelenchoides besseyi]
MSSAPDSYFDSPNWLDRAVNVLDSQMSFNGSTNVTTNVKLQIRFDQQQTQTRRSKPVDSMVTRKKTKSDSNSFQHLTLSSDSNNPTRDYSDDRVTFKGMTERDAIPDAVPVLQHSSTPKKENDYEPLMMFNGDNPPPAKSPRAH